MKKTRLGIIGCGGMARSHASRFNEVLDRVEVAAVVDIQQERAQAVADLLANDPIVETDYQKVLDHVDAVLIVLPHHLHHPVTMAAVGTGVGIMQWLILRRQFSHGGWWVLASTMDR